MANAHNLTVVTTDFGADCDDQKAVSGLISGMKEGERIAFIVNGPDPRSAAAAIAQKYRAATGHDPLITVGRPLGEDGLPERRIYSLLDGTPIGPGALSSIDKVIVPEDRFQRTIDADIRGGRVRSFEQIVLAPLRSSLEYYNPARPELAGDGEFREKWASVEKVATHQFQRSPSGQYGGFNYMNSDYKIAIEYISMINRNGFLQVYVDGVVAKDPRFMMPMSQPRLPGVGKSVEAYIALRQVPWLSLTGDPGEFPGAGDMHAGMFTPDAAVPFGVHVAAANPAGFGARRILKEVCGIDPATEADRHTAALRRLEAELEQFDRQVLAILRARHPELTDVARMRAALHRAMVDALQVFATREGIVGEGESVRDFRELFAAAGRKGRRLNPYQYMKDCNQVLFERSPLARETTEIAVIEKDRPRADGKSHVDAMTSLLGSAGARAVVYDAVAVEASRAVRSHPELRRYFSEGDGVINITQESVSRLRDVNPGLYRQFQADVVSGLVRDGGRTAASH